MSKNTWEKIYNPDFNYGEFAVIKSQIGLNAHLINEGFLKSQRVEKLNKIAISQMKILYVWDITRLKQGINK